MINWFKYPFIRLLVPFSIGIWLCFSFLWNDAVFDFRQFLPIAALMSVSLFMISRFVMAYSRRWIFGLILDILLILIGVLVVRIRGDDLDVRSISFCDGETADAFVARVSECPTVKEKSVKVVLEMMAVRSDDSIREATGSVMSYFERSEKSENIRYGDVIVFFDPPDEVEPPRNPEQFDYKRYLSRKGISRQVYLRADRWMLSGMNLSNPIYRFSYWLRDYLLSTMQKLGITGDEFAVASAILIGYDDTLPPELRNSYVAAGAMHILCVSGMHVGVVFMVFSYLLFFLDKRKRWQNMLRQSVLLLLIWTYALLAGLAPSILRATIMLSFVIVGEMLGRKNILLNSLAASAFLLLTINPANLFDIGFLLSYAAVVGIVVLQKPIYCVFYIKNRFIDKIWELTSVSLAAQFATASFSIFFFNQFPLYFWLSNLFMTPVSTVVIIGGMVMLLLSFIPYINMAIAWIVKWMIFLMNYFVCAIENLPLSIVKGLYINDLEFVCLVVIFVLVMMVVKLREKKKVFAIACIMLIFSASQLIREVTQRKQMSFTVYSLSKGTAVDFVCGNEHVLLCDTTVYRNPEIASFSIDNHLIREGVYKIGSFLPFDSLSFENLYVKKRGSMVSFGDDLIGFSDKKACCGVELASKCHFDYFVLYGSDYVDLKKLLNCYMIDLLIIDNSIPEYLRVKIIEMADEVGQKYYDVKSQGAFICKRNVVVSN